MIEYMVVVRDTREPGVLHIETGAAERVGLEADRQRWVDALGRRSFGDAWDRTFLFEKARSVRRTTRTDDGSVPFTRHELTTGTNQIEEQP